MATEYATYSSPLGKIIITTNGTAITRIALAGQRHGVAIGDDWIENPGQPLLAAAVQQLEQYFAGKRTQFELPVQVAGTAFQQQVWQKLASIDYGQTISYAELARRVGNAKAVRAVGLANGRNPLAIVVPCHRVIGANGSLTGYAAGISSKKKLLELEQRTPALPFI